MQNILEKIGNKVKFEKTENFDVSFCVDYRHKSQIHLWIGGWTLNSFASQFGDFLKNILNYQDPKS